VSRAALKSCCLTAKQVRALLAEGPEPNSEVEKRGFEGPGPRSARTAGDVVDSRQNCPRHQLACGLAGLLIRYVSPVRLLGGLRGD
jgi:hypothetical protein